MPPRVETRIVVNVNAIVNGLSDVTALGVGVVNINRFANAAASGLNRFDTSMSRTQRSANRLANDLRQLQRELDALNRKIARDGQFATPADINKAKALTEQIATAQRTVDKQNHENAIASIRKRRLARLQEIEDEKNADLAKQKALDNDFDRRIAQRIAKRKREADAAKAAVETEIRGVSRLARAADVAISPLRRVGQVVVDIFRQVVRQIEFAIAAFVLFAVASPGLVFGALIKEGIEFNSLMEQSRIGLAALLQATQLIFRTDRPNKPLEGIEAFSAAMEIAEGLTQRLQIKIIPLKATSEDLIPIFNQVITSGANAGLTIVELQDTFVSLAAAAQILQIPTARLGTEIRLLLAGTTRETSRLGPALFGSAKAAREFVREHKAAGDLFPLLQNKLAAYNAALLVSTSSFSVLAENSKEVFQRLSALATSTLFEKIKQGLVKITQSFFDLDAGKIKPEFEGLFKFIDQQLGRVGDKINDLVDRIISFLTEIALYVQRNGRYLSDILNTLVAIAQQLGGILGDLISVVGQADNARAKTASWKTILELVATTIAAIRDELKIVVGMFQALAGVIGVVILGGLEAVANVLGIVSQRAAEAAVNLHNARVATQRFAQAGKDRFIEGITFSTTRDQIEAFNEADRVANSIDPDVTGAKFRPFKKNRTPEEQRIANEQLGRDRFTFRPNTDLTTTDTAGGRGAGDKVINRLIQLRRQTLELLRDLYQARLDIERAGEERSFSLFKDAADRQIDQLDDAFDHKIVSTEDYHKSRAAIESAAFNRERKHLVDQFKFEQREAIAAVEAIHSAFDVQANDPRNKDARIQAEIDAQRQIKVAGELNKLEEKRVKLNTDILLLDQQQTEATRRNNLGLEDGLETLRKTNEQVQQQLLVAQGRTTAAEVRRVAEQFRDELLTVLRNSNPASTALSEVIENIRQLGTVTSTQLLSLLTQAELKFDDLSEETKALIALIQKLEQSAVFKGLQTESQVFLDTLDLRRNDIQDQVTLGVLDEAEGRKQVAAAEREVRVEIERVIALMERIPGLTDQEKVALAGLKQQAQQMGREIDTFGATINEGIKSNLTTLGDALVEDFTKIGDHMRRFFANLAVDIGKAIVQTVILQRLFSVLGLNKQGTSGAGSAGGFGGIFSKIIGHSTGGYVEPDGNLHVVHPREWVIPAERVRQYGHGLMNSLTTGTFGRNLAVAGGPQVSRVPKQLPPKVVLLMTGDDLANELADSAGFDRVIVEKFEKHRGAFGV